MPRKTALFAAAILAGVPQVALAQDAGVDPGTTGPAWSPYLVGALIGVLSMLTFYFSDKPLGASTAYARLAGLVGRQFAPRHTDALPFYAKKTPAIDWQVMLVVGILIGGFLAAWTTGHPPGDLRPPVRRDPRGIPRRNPFLRCSENLKTIRSPWLIP